MATLKAYYPESPEPLLVELARSGDRDAFSELVKRHQQPVRQFMRQLSGNQTLADDLAQQVFVKLWIGLRTLRQPQAFPAWFKRLKVNVWREYARRNDPIANAEEWSDDQPLAKSTGPETAHQGLDLEQALTRLPAAVRLCIVLAYVEGMSHGEIVKATRLPLGTVKSHIRRGGEKLKSLLEGYESGQESTNHE